MKVLKKFKEYFKKLDTILLEYLTENQYKYLQLTKEMKPGEGQIYILDRIVDHIGNSNRLFKFGSDNLKSWRYFDKHKKDIYFITDNNYTNVLQTKRVDEIENISILITKPIDLRLNQVKEAIQKDSGYLWLTVDELIFNTFNNDPKWSLDISQYLLKGVLTLEIFEYDIQSHIDNDPNFSNEKSDRSNSFMELKKHIKYIKEQLEIITGHPFKPRIDFESNGVNIKFILNYPRL